MRVLALLQVLMAVSILQAIAASSLSLSESYRLERLGMKSHNEGILNHPPFVYEYTGNSSVFYEANTQELSYLPRACRRPGAVAYEFSLHIVNRFRATLCLKPKKETKVVEGIGTVMDEPVETFSIRLLGRVSSTRIMPLDRDVQKLESYWSNALRMVTSASISENSDLLLATADDKIEIFFKS